MRKITQLEMRVENLEKELIHSKNVFEHLSKQIGRVEGLIYGLKKRVDEQEKFLKETVYPFIAEKCVEDLDYHLKGLGDVIADLFTEEPKKRVKKDTEKTAKNMEKKTTKKTKKENK